MQHVGLPRDEQGGGQGDAGVGKEGHPVSSTQDRYESKLRADQPPMISISSNLFTPSST